MKTEDTDLIIQTAHGELVYRDRTHAYYLNGVRIPSVTTVLSEMAKPALVWWSANVGADTAINALRQLYVQGTPGQDAIEAVIEQGRRAHVDVKQDAGRKGSLVHEAIREYHEDFFNAEPPAERDAAVSWQSFLDWYTASGYRAIETERIVLDREARYVGRFDLLLEHTDGHLALADAKTGRSVYAEHCIQNGAYAECYEHETGLRVAKSLILHCPSGEPLAVVERSRDEWRADFSVFEALLAVRDGRRSLDAAIKTSMEGAAA